MLYVITVNLRINQYRIVRQMVHDLLIDHLPPLLLVCVSNQLHQVDTLPPTFMVLADSGSLRYTCFQHLTFFTSQDKCLGIFISISISISIHKKIYVNKYEVESVYVCAVSITCSVLIVL